MRERGLFSVGTGIGASGFEHAILANRMQPTTVEVESGHLAMIRHPREIANLILQASGRPPGQT